MRVLRRYPGFILLVYLFGIGGLSAFAASGNPKVVMETNVGTMTIELYPQAAPITVDNFLFYVNTGFYDYLLFHRVIPGFMIQGGGYYLNGYTIYPVPPTTGTIINESDNGLSNLRGTIAMARTNDPDSATSQFFINHVDNLFLDRENASDGFGYCVFGRVIEGMEVVDAIAQIETYYVSAALANFPVDPPVVMSQVRVLPAELSYESNFYTDSFINFSDFALFASNWLDECSSGNAFCGGTDLNYSGEVDVADLDIFLAHWTRRVGYEPQVSDIISDGTVNSNDLMRFIENWLHSGCAASDNYCGGADLNHSGIVDIADFALFSANWLAGLE
jgi:cyclophilin family peptidyl-prolyl cis-trans isomerase